MPAQWQIRIDDGHQQRYLPDRQAVLRNVLTVGRRAASPRFEVFRESDPVVLGDGSPGGRAFSPVQVDDLHQRERPPARRAVAQHDRIRLAEHLEPGAGRLEPHGKHVAQHRLPIRQVTLLVTVVEADLPLRGHCRPYRCWFCGWAPP